MPKDAELAARQDMYDKKRKPIKDDPKNSPDTPDPNMGAQENPAYILQVTPGAGSQDPEKEMAKLIARLKNPSTSPTGKIDHAGSAMLPTIQDDAKAAMDFFKYYIGETVQMEPADLIGDVMKSVGNGTTKPSPELLNWLLANAPQAIRTPTPRKMAIEGVGTAIFSMLARVGQAASGQPGVPQPAAGASVLAAGSEGIMASIAADRQLEMDVLKKNAEIQDKYRDDVIKAWTEFDKRASESEKLKMGMITNVINQQYEFIKAKMKFITDQAQTAGNVARDLITAAQVANTADYDRFSRENIVEFEQNKQTERANARNILDARTTAVTAMGKLVDLQQKNIIKGSELLPAQVGATFETGEEYLGIDGQMIRTAMVQNVDADVARKLAPVFSGWADDIGNAIVNASKEVSPAAAGNIFNAAAATASIGVYVDPESIRTMSDVGEAKLKSVINMAGFAVGKKADVLTRTGLDRLSSRSDRLYAAAVMAGKHTALLFQEAQNEVDPAKRAEKMKKAQAAREELKSLVSTAGEEPLDDNMRRQGTTMAVLSLGNALYRKRDQIVAHDGGLWDWWKKKGWSPGSDKTLKESTSEEVVRGNLEESARMKAQ